MTKSPQIRKKAAENLLIIFNPLGIRKQLIFDNVTLIEEENFSDAREYLVRISKRFFFWWEKDLKKAVLKALNAFVP